MASRSRQQICRLADCLQRLNRAHNRPRQRELGFQRLILKSVAVAQCHWQQLHPRAELVHESRELVQLRLKRGRVAVDRRVHLSMLNPPKVELCSHRHSNTQPRQHAKRVGRFSCILTHTWIGQRLLDVVQTKRRSRAKTRLSIDVSWRSRAIFRGLSRCCSCNRRRRCSSRRVLGSVASVSATTTSGAAAVSTAGTRLFRPSNPTHTASRLGRFARATATAAASRHAVLHRRHNVGNHGAQERHTHVGAFWNGDRGAHEHAVARRAVEHRVGLVVVSLAARDGAHEPSSSRSGRAARAHAGARVCTAAWSRVSRVIWPRRGRRSRRRRRRSRRVRAHHQVQRVPVLERVRRDLLVVLEHAPAKDEPLPRERHARLDLHHFLQLRHRRAAADADWERPLIDRAHVQ